MKRLLVLGAGTAGTMIVNKLRHRLEHEWQITVVDRDDVHYYQPDYTFLPFGDGTADEEVARSRHAQIADGIDFVIGDVELVDAEHDSVRLVGGRALDYDYLVIATGVSPRPDQTPGMLGSEWRRSIFDFYTFDGAQALEKALADFEGGRFVVHITDMPIKCPVAPLELVFLADAAFRARGIREHVDMVFVTPLSGAFTKPVASAHLGAMLENRRIAVETDFLVERIDPGSKRLVSYDEREVPFDLLVTVPLNMGADFVGRSGLGNELNLVPVFKHSMLSKQFANVFALGDASDIPTSKAGSVAHFSVDVFVDNFVSLAHGKPMTASFDGHANCFLETGDGKALLIDFNYDTEPLPGKYPVPHLGPFTLLEETHANHAGKLAFRWVYWNVLLPGHPIPLPDAMTMAGKHLEKTAAGGS